VSPPRHRGRARDHDDREHHGRGMRPLRALVSLDEAMGMLDALAHPIERTERAPLLEALHRVAARDVVSGIDVPLADRAAMDGYAVRAADTYRARKFAPAELRRIETLYADSVPRKRVAKGTAVEVATGSTLSKGADAVVMVEDTEREGETVRVYAPVHPGENVSPRGEDIRKGEAVVRAGEFLTPAKVGAIAAVGAKDVEVFARPRVAILTTGDEVVPPGAAIRPGQVYDINAHTIASVVREAGGEPVLLGRVPDRLEALKAAIRRAVRHDLAVFSGGSSVGEKDMVLDVLQAMGEVRFHGVAVKPGKPTVLGVVGGTAVLGMPGYPTSCLSNCYMMLAPMLRTIARVPPAHEKVVELPLSKRIVSSMGRVEFHTVRVEDGSAVPAYKESGAITSMAHADGYIEIPANVDLVEKGERVRVVLF
jgi:molybdopterin molybdotransferase